MSGLALVVLALTVPGQLEYKFDNQRQELTIPVQATLFDALIAGETLTSVLEASDQGVQIIAFAGMPSTRGPSEARPAVKEMIELGTKGEIAVELTAQEFRTLREGGELRFRVLNEDRTARRFTFWLSEDATPIPTVVGGAPPLINDNGGNIGTAGRGNVGRGTGSNVGVGRGNVGVGRGNSGVGRGNAGIGRGNSGVGSGNVGQGNGGVTTGGVTTGAGVGNYSTAPYPAGGYGRNTSTGNATYNGNPPYTAGGRYQGNTNNSTTGSTGVAYNQDGTLAGQAGSDLINSNEMRNTSPNNSTVGQGANGQVVNVRGGYNNYGTGGSNAPRGGISADIRNAGDDISRGVRNGGQALDQGRVLINQRQQFYDQYGRPIAAAVTDQGGPGLINQGQQFYDQYGRPIVAAVTGQGAVGQGAGSIDPNLSVNGQGGQITQPGYPNGYGNYTPPNYETPNYGNNVGQNIGNNVGQPGPNYGVGPGGVPNYNSPPAGVAGSRPGYTPGSVVATRDSGTYRDPNYQLDSRYFGGQGYQGNGAGQGTDGALNNQNGVAGPSLEAPDARTASLDGDNIRIGDTPRNNASRPPVTIRSDETIRPDDPADGVANGLDRERSATDTTGLGWVVCMFLIAVSSGIFWLLRIYQIRYRSLLREMRESGNLSF